MSLFIRRVRGEISSVPVGAFESALRDLRAVQSWLKRGEIAVGEAEKIAIGKDAAEDAPKAYAFANQSGLSLRHLGYLSIFPPYNEAQPNLSPIFSYTIQQPSGHRGEMGSVDVFRSEHAYVFAEAPYVLSPARAIDRKSWIGRSAASGLVTVIKDSGEMNQQLAPRMMDLFVEASHAAFQAAEQHRVVAS